MADDDVNPLGTPTTNYGWTKPTVGADLDVWGGYLNADLDGIDSIVFGIQGSVPGPSTTPPAMDGTQTIGTSALFARADHIHPTDTSRYAASNPSGFVTAAGAASAAPVQSVASKTGAVTLIHSDITDWAAQASTTSPIVDGTATAGSSGKWSDGAHIHPTDTTRAPLASPTFTGTVIAPTPVPQTDNSTKVATTAFVQGAITANAYALPTASTTVLGGVKVDGSTITIASGVISSAAAVTPSSTTPAMNGTAAIGTGRPGPAPITSIPATRRASP